MLEEDKRQQESKGVIDAEELSEVDNNTIMVYGYDNNNCCGPSDRQQ